MSIEQPRFEGDFQIQKPEELTRRKALTLLAGSLLGQTESEAAEKRKAGQPADLKGSVRSLDRQNKEVADHDLTRIKDKAQLQEFIKKGLLVKLPENKYLQIDPSLPEYRRYCRPWTKRFLEDLGNEFFKKYNRAEKIMVTSAVRPTELQEKLKNPNASPRSTHPTGATVDILYGPKFRPPAKNEKKGTKPVVIYGGMTKVQKASMDKYLLAYERKKMLEGTKERLQPCYHIMVYKEYKKDPNLKME